MSAVIIRPLLIFILTWWFLSFFAGALPAQEYAQRLTCREWHILHPDAILVSCPPFNAISDEWLSGGNAIRRFFHIAH